MKKIAVGLISLMFATAVYARCTTQTINQGGRLISCTVCCDQYGNCNTFCI